MATQSESIRFIRTLPKSVQIASALLMAVCVTLPVGLQLRTFLGRAEPAPDSPGQAPLPPAYSRGIQVQPPGNYEVPDTHKAEEQLMALHWHAEHPEHDVPWVDINPGDQATNYVKYKFYKNSDRCVFVLRSENGSKISKWIMNPMPQRKLHPDLRVGDDSRLNGDPGKAGPTAPVRHEPQGIISWFDTPLHAAGLEASVAATSSGAAPPQCQDPHPGRFKWWWGPPENQCWSPMFREFADGCIHYQRYNRCTDAWDPGINWTRCVH